ncbi:hypothetical protein ACLOJK_028153 [Asimina triloba]
MNAKQFNELRLELFSEVGDLKRYSIHYDRSGRSKGTAEVVFARRTDAMAAVKRYNNVQLDGKPMKIEIVGTNIATPAAVPQVANGTFGNPNGVLRREEEALLDGHEVEVEVEVEGEDVDLEGGAEDEEWAVVSRSLQKSLMQSWRNTMQKECRSTKTSNFCLKALLGWGRICGRHPQTCVFLLMVHQR